MKILIDNGHGVDTPGKCSPDRRLLEWRYAREIAGALAGELKKRGADAELLVTEDHDVSLSRRALRVNGFCSRLGAENVVLVSIHVNAADSDGRWHEARGWSGWVCRGASHRSRRLAALLYDCAAARGLKGNRAVPSCKYWTADFAILRKTRCAAVLTENLFQDNREDVDLLLSQEGRKKIVDLHVEAISAFVSDPDGSSGKKPTPAKAAVSRKAVKTFTALAVALSLFSAGGCTKKVYVPLEARTVVTDTLWRSLSRCDTLREHDSVYIFERGDTLREFRLRERLRYRDRIDTLYRTRCDTVLIERPVPVATKANPTFMEKIRYSFKGFLVGLLLVAVAVAAWWGKKNFKGKN